MKNLIYRLSSILLITLIINGCNFLDETPTAQLSTEDYYKTAQDAQRAINAAYTQMSEIDIYARYPKVGFGEIMTNNALKGGGGPGDQAQIYQLKHFNASSDNSALENAWVYNYKGVYLTNVVLSKVSKIEMDQEEKDFIIGQAHFLRAYFYVQLVRIFGNIPLVKKPLEPGSYDKPQVKPDKIWNFILQEADSAMSLLPTKEQLSDDELGKATKGAAATMKLYAYLWLENYGKVEELGDKIIRGTFGSYSLAPDFTKIWTVEGEFGPGSIFEINYANILGKDLGNILNRHMASKATWGWGFDTPTQNLVDAYEKGDPRLKATVIQTGDTLAEGYIAPEFVTKSPRHNRKYWLPPSKIPTNNLNWGGITNERIFRLAEVMLWDAEASVHNGNIGHATDLVNEVRTRARNSGNNTDMSVLPDYSSVALDDVYHEQRVETAMGSHRWFYNLVRTGRAVDRLKGYEEGVNNLFPIPENQINLSNGVLKQNPGY